MIRDTSSSSSMIWFWAVALRMMVSTARVVSSGESLPRWSSSAQPTMAVERRPELVGQGRQELVLQAVRGLGGRARLLRLPVEVRVVHGDGRVCGEAGDQALVTLVEEPGIGMPEEETAEQLAGARAHRRRDDSSARADCRAASA